MIDVPDDAGDDAVVVTASAKTLRIIARSDLVVIVDLAGGYNVLFAAVVIDGLVGGMIDFNMLTEFRMFMVVAAVVVLDVFAAV